MCRLPSSDSWAREPDPCGEGRDCRALLRGANSKHNSYHRLLLFIPPLPFILQVDSKPSVQEVRWVRDGRFVQTQFRHLIPRANLKDAGPYICSADNGLGQVSSHLLISLRGTNRRFTFKELDQQENINMREICKILNS